MRTVGDKWVTCDDSGTVGQWVETGVCQGDVKLTREVYIFINNASGDSLGLGTVGVDSGLRQGSVRVM